MTDDRDKNSKEHGETDEAGFGLSPPTGEMANKPSGDRPPAAPVEAPPTSSAAPSSGDRAERGVVWKGFEEEEEYEPEVHFELKRDYGDEDMDMTPMVDVVFLLLIFFMVTASFTLQKSIQQPKVKSDEPTTAEVEEPEDTPDYIEIIIDQHNTYRLTSRNVEEAEAPSDTDMRAKLKDMIDTTAAKKLIITAHGDCMHKKVVTAWDAGTHNDIEEIVIQLTEEDY